MQSQVRIKALAAVTDTSEKMMQRNVWLLNEAGFSQGEMAKILGTSQPTISRILAGGTTLKGKELVKE
jgi:DNA-binding transcriptional regulator LsrR (DeoR family)